MNEWIEIQKLVISLLQNQRNVGTNRQGELLREQILEKAKQPLKKKAQHLRHLGKLPRDSAAVEIYVSYCLSAISRLLLDKKYDPSRARVDTRLQKVFELEIPRKVWQELVDPSATPMEALRTDWENIEPKEIEPAQDDGMIWPWHFEKTVENERLPHVRWEMSLKDVAAISQKFARWLLRMWDLELSKNHSEPLAAYRTQITAILDSGDRTYLKRLVYGKGARGQLDTSTLEKPKGITYGTEVYDRRMIWKTPRQASAAKQGRSQLGT